jgi:hypothetical protein
MRGNWQHGAPQEGLDTKPTPLQVSGRFVAEFAANICAAKLGEFAALIFAPLDDRKCPQGCFQTNPKCPRIAQDSPESPRSACFEVRQQNVVARSNHLFLEVGPAILPQAPHDVSNKPSKPKKRTRPPGTERPRRARFGSGFCAVIRDEPKLTKEAPRPPQKSPGAQIPALDSVGGALTTLLSYQITRLPSYQVITLLLHQVTELPRY